MLHLLLILLTLFCALRAVTADRLIRSALWLAGVSAFTAILLFRIGAHEVAVIELSVGAGLVTVLFVFAIAIAGEDAMGERPVVPKWLALATTLISVALLAWMVLPAESGQSAGPQSDFAAMLWQERGLDALVQVGLIFAGVMGVLGLLAPVPARFQLPAVSEERALAASPPVEPRSEPLVGQEA